MANFRFNCPSCQMPLELDERHAGQEVECGHCYQVFIAPRVLASGELPSSGRRQSRIPSGLWDTERPRRRSRYTSDDDFAPPTRSGSQSDAWAIIALVLGGVSPLLACCCWPLGLATSTGAIITGILGLRSSANQVMAILGLIFGVLSFGLGGVAILIGLGNAVINR